MLLAFGATQNIFHLGLTIFSPGGKLTESRRYCRHPKKYLDHLKERRHFLFLERHQRSTIKYVGQQESPYCLWILVRLSSEPSFRVSFDDDDNWLPYIIILIFFGVILLTKSVAKVQTQSQGSVHGNNSAAREAMFDVHNGDISLYRSYPNLGG